MWLALDRRGATEDGWSALLDQEEDKSLKNISDLSHIH